MKQRRSSFILLGASLLVSILVAEGCLWLVSPIGYHTTPEWQSDGHIRGRYAPGQTFQTGPGHNALFPIRREEHLNRINRFGFRGRDYDLNPDSAAVRIAVFGGSAAFNFHDPEKETWPQRLGTCLTEELGVETEVLNFALPGFTLGISKINYLVNGRAFRPDIAIAYHTWNDLKMVGRISVDVEQLLDSPVARPAALPESLGRWVSRYSQVVRRSRVLYHRFSRADREGSAIQDTDWEPSGRAGQWFASNFSDFIRLALADSAVPIIATQGALVASENLSSDEIARHIGNEMVGLTPDSLVELWNWANDTIRQIGFDHDVPVVDVYRLLPHSMTYLEDHVHLTPQGQVEVANIFCSTMAEAEMVRTLYRNRSPDGQRSDRSQ